MDREMKTPGQRHGQGDEDTRAETWTGREKHKNRDMDREIKKLGQKRGKGDEDTRTKKWKRKGKH